MPKIHSLGLSMAVGITAGLIALSSAIPTQAQIAADNSVNINVSDLDQRAASEATLKHHAMPANTPARKKPSALSNMHESQAAHQINLFAPTLFPADLSFQGGKVVEFAQSHPIFLFSTSAHCTSPACWGNPSTFLQDLGNSTIIHVVDQYTENHADHRYTLGTSLHHNIGPSTKTKPLVDADMAAFAHAAAVQLGESGYSHIFHIFLPPGQDVCFTATDGVCYSPDVPATFAFCAYHSSADFTDGRHVLYTVEPFQNVPGCNVQPGTPNGQLVDSTASTLSHETIETITDPDGTAWWNNTGNLDLNGFEIADECQYFEIIGQNAFGAAPTIQIGPKKFAIQREYNNDRHACTETP
jgi:hypothetical protein